MPYYFKQFEIIYMYSLSGCSHHVIKEVVRTVECFLTNEHNEGLKPRMVELMRLSSVVL